MYNGGKCEVVGNEISGCWIKSQIKQIDNYISLCHQFGFLSVKVSGPSEFIENGNTFDID